MVPWVEFDESAAIAGAEGREGQKPARLTPMSIPTPWARASTSGGDVISARAPARAAAPSLGGMAWLALFALHVPLVIGMKASVAIATAHAAMVLMLGLLSLQRRTPTRLIFVLGYVVASEPLWRVAHAAVFYETAKYTLVALGGLGIIRWRRDSNIDKTPAVYLALLMPSLLVLDHFDRKDISFNLSGPVALAVFSMFMSRMRISKESVRTLLLVVLAPIFGLLVVASYSTITTDVIEFATTKLTGGGLGKNQASAIFGLGMLVSFLFVVVSRRSDRLRWWVSVLGIWCGVQAMLTWSRGGVVTALGAMAVGSVVLLSERRSRSSIALRVAMWTLLAISVVLPQLQTFTGGSIGVRFTSTDLTGRDDYIRADIQTFRENPVLGVGPGVSKQHHFLLLGRAGSSHTEYSRLLAEHGSLGLMALVLLGIMSVVRVRSPLPVGGRAMTLAFTVWSLLYLTHAAMRMAAASFIFGLGGAHLLVEPRRRRSRLAAVSADDRSRPGPIGATRVSRTERKNGSDRGTSTLVPRAVP